MKNNLQSPCPVHPLSLSECSKVCQGISQTFTVHSRCISKMQWKGTTLKKVAQTMIAKGSPIQCPSVFPLSPGVSRSDWFPLDEHKNRNWPQVWRVLPSYIMITIKHQACVSYLYFELFLCTALMMIIILSMLWMLKNPAGNREAGFWPMRRLCF